MNARYDRHETFVLITLCTQRKPREHSPRGELFVNTLIERLEFKFGAFFIAAFLARFSIHSYYLQPNPPFMRFIAIRLRAWARLTKVTSSNQKAHQGKQDRFTKLEWSSA
jgi:hypothetical protein